MPTLVVGFLWRVALCTDTITQIGTIRLSLSRFDMTGVDLRETSENIAQLGYAGWAENVVDSTRFDRIDSIRLP